MKNTFYFLKITAAVGFLAMIYVNYLANALPIGGVTTGEASDAYANLFTPAGITFSIWGLIYLLLGAYVVYQFVYPKHNKSEKHEKLLSEINRYFILSSLANIAWIFAWHYGVIWLSVIIMLLLLACLIKLAEIFKKQSLKALDYICIKLPFSLYFGWISVATIANITVLLVSLNWNRFGLLDVFWVILILFVGAGVGIWRMLKDRNPAYGLVFVWAYSGIVLKHLTKDGFAGQYPNVIISAIACIGLLILSVVYLYINKSSTR
ncbi:MAG TPA: tryptophan-rich sensory protein [bacterium]|mgnify:CR=1|nr:MAG: hypothetical protein BWY14_01116 [Parcubacteria group bacterium ADurb.Bin192]HPN14843.1 tryptophan-rich sensory protein [bacterium]